MENLGPTLREWRAGWTRRIGEPQTSALDLPLGALRPSGYVVTSFGAQDEHALGVCEGWQKRIPATYQRVVLGDDTSTAPSVDADPHCLAALRHYRSLMPLASSAHKPMFSLRGADGARGAHLEAVQACHADFLGLARRIATTLSVELP